MADIPITIGRALSSEPESVCEEASEGYLLLLVIISVNHTEAVVEDEEYDEEEMGRKLLL